MTVRTDTRLPLFETITPPYPTPHFSNTTEDLLFNQHGARQCNLANNCCSTGYLTFFFKFSFRLTAALYFLVLAQPTNAPPDRCTIPKLNSAHLY